MILDVVSGAAQGIYFVAKETPGWTFTAMKNTSQGCYQNPKAIPVLASSLAMANGGAAAAYKCAKSAVDSFKKRELLQGAVYTGGTVAAGTLSFIGGISTIVLTSSSVSEWQGRDFSVIKDTMENTYNVGKLLCENALEIPRWGFEVSKFVIEKSMKNPVPASTSTFAAAASAIGAVASYRFGKRAVQAFKAGEYAKSGANLALTGVASVASAVSAASSVTFFIKLCVS